MTLKLTTPREAESLIARMFLAGGPCSVEVREDKAFGDRGWLNLGQINLFTANGTNDQMECGVRRGSFDWDVPELSVVKSELAILLNVAVDTKNEPKLRRALDAIAAISVRSGLQHPKFDPYAFENLPFRRSMTVVADTSGAIQGGLDFVARYLHPAARVKVPGIVQMEIVNFADRFLSGRRAAKIRPADLLIDHLMSQGGQRVLLRLELQAETEIERTFLLGDPLRSAFQVDGDNDLRELNLSVAVRGYADRLILESARQHRAQANHGHQVQLLTSDQGLARMAMAEGITPLFFGSVQAADFFGRRLTGATLNPFTGNLDELSLSSLLWEAATAFGSARLCSQDGSQCLKIAAIGEGLSWSPYQSHADLLWCDDTTVPEWPSAEPKPKPAKVAPDAVISEAPRTRIKAEPKVKAKVADAKVATPISVPAGAKRPPSSSMPRINVGTAFRLIDELDNRQNFTGDDAVIVAQTKNKMALEDYRRFLLNANLIAFDSNGWRANAATQEFAIALRHEDVAKVRSMLLASPAYSMLSTRLAGVPIGQTWDPAEYNRALTTSRTFAEVTNIAMNIAGEGIYPTPSNPTALDFASIALARYAELDRGDGLVAAGAWLESLVRMDGIHPEIARTRLGEANAAGMLRRTTEGSTTDTRFEDHTFHALRVVDGSPVVRPVHLYRGDYLIPGKSSTSLRIEGQPA
ncbi:hypothetical protein [Sphingomonas cynarae]|uniref:hypothetical protein n=1 Tax=Sphingomonas cynarae TaxID=930197 RepID=UPI0031CE9711